MLANAQDTEGPGADYSCKLSLAGTQKEVHVELEVALT